MKGLKILHLGKYYYPHTGGVETYTRTIAEALVRKKSNKVETIVNNKENYQKIETINGVKVIRLPRHGDIFHAPFSKFPFGYIKKSKFDIIHLHVPNPWLELNLLLYFLICGKKEKLVITYHADVPHYTIFHKIMDYIRTVFAYPLFKFYADAVLPTSSNYIQGSCHLRKLRKKITVVPIGIDTKSLAVDKNNLEKIKQKYKIKDNEKIVLFNGRLVKYKGVEYLLEAVSILNKKRNDFKLVIAGNGDLYTELTNKAKKLSQDIIFTGYVDDLTMNSLRKLCSVFVLPSINRGEAFGISIIEAMYFKKPVITTNIKHSGVSYVNIQNRTGLVVEPKNPEQIAKAIDYLLSNPKRAEQLGINGYNRVLENFTEEKFVGKIESVYNSILEKQKICL